jgi:hypothetical protein
VEIVSQAKKRGLSTSLDPQKLIIPTQRSLIEVLAKVLPFTDMLLLDEDEANRLRRQMFRGDALLLAGQRVHCRRQARRRRRADCRHDRVFEQPAVFVPNDQIVEAIGQAML